MAKALPVALGVMAGFSFLGFILAGLVAFTDGGAVGFVAVGFALMTTAAGIGLGL